MMISLRIFVILLAATISSTARAETKDEWIALGAQIHGAFGPFIPVGIRIGLDAVDRLKTDGRGLTVIYHHGVKPPCPCVADGVMIATRTSPGQGSMQMSPSQAPDGMMAMIVISNRHTGKVLRYTIADHWLPKILGWRSSDPSARYDAAMSAEGLFEVEPMN